MRNSLKTEIESLEEVIGRHKEWLKDLKSKREVTNEEFYDNISAFVDVIDEKREKTSVIIGDGRSNAGIVETDEVILDAYTNNEVYFSDDQILRLRDYVVDIHPGKHIRFHHGNSFVNIGGERR